MKPTTSDLPMIMNSIYEIGLNVNVSITVFLSLPFFFLIHGAVFCSEKLKTIKITKLQTFSLFSCGFSYSCLTLLGIDCSLLRQIFHRPFFSS